MDLLGGIILTEENLVFFATGLGVGAMLWAAGQSSLQRRRDPQALAQRVAKLEMRLAAGKNLAALATAMQTVEQTLPLIGEPRVVTYFASAQWPKLKSPSHSDPEDIAKEFGDAMRDILDVRTRR